MLFSRPEIAEYMSDMFEPVWEQVRPVPLVRIDFGGGKVVTRTLYGNIATWVCTPDGKVLDILPGLYEPLAYLDQLEQLVTLHKWFGRQGERFVKDYHRKQTRLLAAEKTAHRLVDPADFAKAIVEDRLKEKLKISALKERLAAAVEKPGDESTAEVAGWKALADDTKHNESARRRQIHAYLAEHGVVSPGTMTTWLYRAVLHTDLEDPYLGLANNLAAGDRVRENEPR